MRKKLPTLMSTRKSNVYLRMRHRSFLAKQKINRQISYLKYFLIIMTTFKIVRVGTLGTNTKNKPVSYSVCFSLQLLSLASYCYGV